MSAITMGTRIIGGGVSCLVIVYIVVQLVIRSDSVQQSSRLLEKDWWETASFYQIYPRSFKDSDGDGIGDLNGIREKVPYLKEVGFNATWLSPIFRSPMKDFGYDISDFYGIQPEYGTMSDFEGLLKAVKAAGIKLILDFVPNHSSDQNEWFVKSINREPGYEDFYVWHPGYPDPEDASKRLPPNNWLSVFWGSAWEWNSVRGEFYYHAFTVQQPDLNYRSANVVNQMKEVLRFWLDKGVDGFRVDAVPCLFEVAADAAGHYPDEPPSGTTDDPQDFTSLKHVYTQGQEESYEMIYLWRELLDQYQRDHGGSTRVMLAEAFDEIHRMMRYYGDEKGREGAHIPMNFFLLMNLNGQSNARAFKEQIDIWMDNMPRDRTAHWVIGNHDQRRVASRFGTDRIDMMNVIDLTLPGVSITYNGDEFGMTDVWISWANTKDPAACNTNEIVYEQYSRDPARTPLQWDSTVSAGFSMNAVTWLPVAPDYTTVNVRLQEQDEKSHLGIFKELIRLRQHETFKYGNLETFTVANGQVLVMIRRIDDDHDIFVIIANILGDPALVDRYKIQRIPAPNLQHKNSGVAIAVPKYMQGTN